MNNQTVSIITEPKNQKLNQNQTEHLVHKVYWVVSFSFWSACVGSSLVWSGYPVVQNSLRQNERKRRLFTQKHKKRSEEWHRECQWPWLMLWTYLLQPSSYPQPLPLLHLLSVVSPPFPSPPSTATLTESYKYFAKPQPELSLRVRAATSPTLTPNYPPAPAKTVFWRSDKEPLRLCVTNSDLKIGSFWEIAGSDIESKEL